MQTLEAVTERITERVTRKIHQITLIDTQESFSCRENETVLAAMLRQRKGDLRCGCFGGGCGICRMWILDGDCQQIKPMSRAHVSSAEQAEGLVLLCCVQPRGDMTLARIKDAL